MPCADLSVLSLLVRTAFNLTILRVLLFKESPMCVSQSALPVRADGTDQQLLESVIEFYRNRFVDESAPSQFLADRNLVHPDLVATFELGYADRELGRLLPPRQNKLGRELRARLQHLGVYRASGHGHFNGSLVVPLRSAAGQVVNLYGRKTGHKLAGGSLHAWLAEPCGLFNGHVFTNSAELILTDSILNAMSFWCAELPDVTCTFGLTAMHDDLAAAFQAPHIKRVYLAQRNTPGGDNGAADCRAGIRRDRVAGDRPTGCHSHMAQPTKG
jgi:hypothetical protein